MQGQQEKVREHVTGSVRDSREGKGRYDLVSPHAIRLLAERCEFGAKKYGDRNWEKGQPISWFVDSALRHLSQMLEGRQNEDHLSAALWNLHAAAHTRETALRGKLPLSLIDTPCCLGVADSDPWEDARELDDLGIDGFDDTEPDPEPDDYKTKPITFYTHIMHTTTLPMGTEYTLVFT